MDEQPFWKRKTLEEMTREEWESLCDGCGKCCLFRLMSNDLDGYHTTNVICRYFNESTCRCTEYEERTRLVGSCLKLTPQLVRTLEWMPTTCAYRLLAKGLDLPWWHPLVSGDPNTVYQAGISVRGKVESELAVSLDDLEDHVVDWFDQPWMLY